MGTTTQQQLCITRDCQRCDMGYILKDYVHPLIQLLTNDITTFNMSLLTTKCLNTAVMLMYFMVGPKGLKAAEVCDCASFREASERRSATDPHQNLRICTEMSTKILASNKFASKHRELFYILVTDADFIIDPPLKTTPDQQPAKKYFPGHVIVIEKIPPSSTQIPELPTYNLYQSYIYEYDLRGQLNKNNQSFSVDHASMQEILDNLTRVMTATTWTADIAAAWKDITYVDTAAEFAGANCRNRFFICYHRMTARHCIERIESYATRALKRINHEASKLKKPFKEIYGNMRLYSSGDVKPLTRYEIKVKLEGLVNAIIANKERL